MDRTQLALLVLLRAGLWERKADDCACFPLSMEEWGRVYLLARQQTVIGLVFQGIRQLPECFFPPELLLVRWMAETDAIERRNVQMNRVLASLVRLFASEGICPVLQKGQGLAGMYVNPLLRECGDIDFYFDSRLMSEKALSLMRRYQIKEKRRADRSVVYTWKGVVVEHHTKLLDVHNPFLQGYARKLEQRYGYDTVCLGEKETVDLRVPSPVLNLSLQSLHILKHAVGWGIGLRQLCDMARSCYKLQTKTEPDEMKKIAGILGIDRWNLLLHAFLVEQLGLPVKYLPYPETAPESRPLSSIVWRGGNFGQYASGRQATVRNFWTGKWQTACAFRHNAGFALRYAPKEGIWAFADLVKGQFK